MDLLSGQAKLRHRAGQVDVRRCVAVEIPAPELGPLKRVGNGGLTNKGNFARPTRIPAPSSDEHDQGWHLGKGADRGEPAGDQDLNRPSHDARSGKAGLASR